MNNRKRVMVKRVWCQIKSTPFVQSRFSTLYGIIAGIFLSAAMEFLLSSFTRADGMSGCLELPGALFLAASVALALISWEMQSFGSYLSRHGALDASNAVKRDELGQWGQLRRLWVYLTISGLSIVAGVMLLLRMTI